MVEIEQILRQMKQGQTSPYLCIGNDNNKYVVKGIEATYQGLIKEWLIGNIGRSFELPIPHCEIVWLDGSLLEYTDFKLTEGYCFASLYQEDIQEVRFSQLNNLDQSKLKDLFVFDYWVKNNDRTLSAYGGNPNLFYDHSMSSMVVLDHNLAFDCAFSCELHKSTHPYANGWNGLDLVDKVIYEQRFDKALIKINDIIDSIPNDWLASYSMAKIHSNIVEPLQSYKDPNVDFWGGIS